jgi:hypothetical protein
MNIFGFVIGTTLVNLLFVFDLYVTKFQQRKSVWGSTMVLLKSKSAFFNVIPLYTVICLWLIGLLYGNVVTHLQIWLSCLFWLWMVSLYAKTTYHYYKDKVHLLDTK